MAYLDELKTRRGEIEIKLHELKKIIREYARLQEEMSSIDSILNLYRESVELPSEPTTTQPELVSTETSAGKRLAPGVATEAFDILMTAKIPMTIREIHEVIQSRGNIFCNQSSVGVAMRRNSDHFKRVDHLKWEAININKDPQVNSPGGQTYMER